MRLVEDMLLQLILQGESFTYRCDAFCHHAAPDCATPCCTHHHHVASHHTSLIMTIPITILHYVPLLQHVSILTYVLAASCLLSLSCLLYLSCLLLHASYPLHARCRIACLVYFFLSTIQLSQC